MPRHFIYATYYGVKGMQVISKADAKAQGLTHYFTGKPCKHGHVAQRYVTKSTCVECTKASGQRREVARKAKGDPRRYSEESRKVNRERSRRWYQANKERQKQRGRQRYQANKASHAATNKRWRSKNKESVDKRVNKWREDNRERHLRNMRRWARKQYATNPEYRITQAMRRMVGRSLSNKSDRTSDLLGYTAAELRQHIERQFEPGMSWEAFNRGEIHIDHVVSIKQMLEEGETDPAVINSLANLRPMWAKDNMAKGSERQFLL